MVVLSGLHASGSYAPGARVEEGRHQLPGGDIKQVRMAIVAAGDQDLPSGLNATDTTPLLPESEREKDQLPGGDIPQVRMAVVRRRPGSCCQG